MKIFLSVDILRGNGGSQHPHDVIFRVLKYEKIKIQIIGFLTRYHPTLAANASGNHKWPSDRPQTAIRVAPKGDQALHLRGHFCGNLGGSKNASAAGVG